MLIHIPVLAGMESEDMFPGGTGRGIIQFIGRQGALCGNINRASGLFYATEHAVVVDFKEETDFLWALYYLEYLNQYATAAAQPGLSVKKIGKVSVTVPTFAEQVEISRLLDNALNALLSVYKSVKVVLGTMDLMKKAILGRAFRGLLGTKTPAETCPEI